MRVQLTAVLSTRYRRSDRMSVGSTYRYTYSELQGYTSMRVRLTADLSIRYRRSDCMSVRSTYRYPQYRRLNTDSQVQSVTRVYIDARSVDGRFEYTISTFGRYVGSIYVPVYTVSRAEHGFTSPGDYEAIHRCAFS
jgi:hypothetical protein